MGKIRNNNNNNKPVYEEGDIIVLWNQAIHTGRDVTANRPDIIIKKKRENMRTVRCGNTHRQKCRTKGRGKEVKIQELVHRDTTILEPINIDHTSNNWSHWNSNEKLKEKFGRYTKKKFDRFTTKDSYTWNITHNTASKATSCVPAISVNALPCACRRLAFLCPT
jgi:hypothetical protein